MNGSAPFSMGANADERRPWVGQILRRVNNAAEAQTRIKFFSLVKANIDKRNPRAGSPLRRGLDGESALEQRQAARGVPRQLFPQGFGGGEFHLAPEEGDRFHAHATAVEIAVIAENVRLHAAAAAGQGV